jgi:hypothetical protein
MAPEPYLARAPLAAPLTGSADSSTDVISEIKQEATKMPDQGQTARMYRIGEKEIAKLAYELYEERGRVHGYDVEDWLEAEWELIEKRKVYRLAAAA